jgi:DNA-binding transcriptional LysR family regulator
VDFTLKQLEIFHAIVMSGSISQATRNIGLSQPTLSQQLAKFEDALGTQLIIRSRSNAIKLTVAGEFWYRNASEILNAANTAHEQHKLLYDNKSLVLRFGTTPSLRGQFTKAAAQVALQLDQIARFDFLWGNNSAEVMEMLNTHKLNCAVISAESAKGFKSSLHVEELWQDKLVWTVPASIPDDIIAKALTSKKDPGPDYSALRRFVDIVSYVPWRNQSDDWLRNNLPYCAPFFGCSTHEAAVDIVSAGIATCHSPMSLMPNLPKQVRDQVKMFDLGQYARDVVLVMPKHLLSLKPFKTFCDEISAYSRKTYGDDFLLDELRPLPKRLASE